MQIHGLHRNIYRLYAWARTQECLDAYRIKYEDSVRHWQALRAEGVSAVKCAEFCGISRATYFRRKRILQALAEGVLPPSKAPKRRNKPHWGEAQMQLVLEVRRDNRTYGKDKIAVILARDKGCKISASTVGRILLFCARKARLYAHILRHKSERGTFPKATQNAGLIKITKTWHLVSGFRSTT